jgi:hypothetical protein
MQVLFRKRAGSVSEAVAPEVDSIAVVSGAADPLAVPTPDRSKQKYEKRQPPSPHIRCSQWIAQQYKCSRENLKSIQLTILVFLCSTCAIAFQIWGILAVPASWLFIAAAVGALFASVDAMMKASKTKIDNETAIEALRQDQSSNKTAIEEVCSDQNQLRADFIAFQASHDTKNSEGLDSGNVSTTNANDGAGLDANELWRVQDVAAFAVTHHHTG